VPDDRARDAGGGEADRDGIVGGVGLAEMLGGAVRMDQGEFAGFYLPGQETIEKGMPR